MDENKYLEEFLISAQSKIEGLSVTTDTRNFNDYEYLIVGFEGMTYKIENSLIKNYTNLIARTNRDVMDVGSQEVNPYRNLGKIKPKVKVMDSSVIDDEEKLAELLEKIVSKIYEQYNFLILPATEEEIDAINPDDFAASKYILKSTQEKTQGQNLYSIGFKIKAETPEGAEYFPLKLYFRLGKTPDGKVLAVTADDFNSMAKSSKLNVLTMRTFTQKEKAKLKKRFENNEFDKDRETIASNIDSIIAQLLSTLEGYVRNFDESPEWFKASELGKYITRLSFLAEMPSVNATASFRYITQTPLPYSYITISMSNTFATELYQIKRASDTNKELNEMLNLCPICGEKINERNRLVSSDEYEKGFIGCEHCMDQKCSMCNSIWSSKKTPVVINKSVSGKYYHVAGACNSSLEYCSHQDCYGTNLCSCHSKRCFDPMCAGNIFCEKVTIKCSNHSCGKTYCLEHAERDLYKCETSVCAKSAQPNRYCSECKDSYLNTCRYCGKTMCSSCSRPVMEQDDSGRFVVSGNSFICLDCLNLMTSAQNRDVNIKNQALIRDPASGEYYPKSMEYLYKYADIDNQYIDKTLAVDAYKQKKPEGWEMNPSLGKLWYRNDDVHTCDACGQLFHMTRPSTENKTSHYCDDDLVTCSLCGSLMVHSSVLKYGGGSFCKRCFNDQWELSDLDYEGAPLVKDKKQIAEEVFADSDIAKSYKVVPVSKKDVFICPDTKYHVSKDQTKTCTSCGETYAVSDFEAGASSCKLCRSLEQFDYQENRDTLSDAFYNKAFGDKSRFQVCCTKNMLLLKYYSEGTYKLDVYYFNKRSGKYRLHKKNVSAKEAGIASEMKKEVNEDAE